jgi:hypothetical protein
LLRYAGQISLIAILMAHNININRIAILVTHNIIFILLTYIININRIAILLAHKLICKWRFGSKDAEKRHKSAQDELIFSEKSLFLSRKSVIA